MEIDIGSLHSCQKLSIFLNYITMSQINANAQADQMVNDSDYSKVIDYIPVRKKHQLIVPFDSARGKYNFTDNDVKFLEKITKNRDQVKSTIRKINSDKGLVPGKNYQTKVRIVCKKQQIVSILLHVVHVILFIVLVYILLGIFIFFLGDPVICFLYCYFVMYQFWWRGGKVGMEMVVESRKAKPLESYLKSLNKKLFTALNLRWQVGGNGKWIQVDDLKFNPQQK